MAELVVDVWRRKAVVGQGDVVDVALKLGELNVESIPVNFLHAIDGTPLQSQHELDPRYCDVAIDRLLLAFGEEPVARGSGLTFSETAQLRASSSHKEACDEQ